MTALAAPPLARRRSIADVLEDARSRLDRLTPAQAVAARAAGAVVVDIRPAAQRAVQGGPDDVLVIERNVLEWRLDPQSDAALPIASYDLEVVVLCQEGFTSSLAAAALQDLGIHRATDVAGGWAAWRDELGA
ncbi:Rhodanese-related sulfurtransferase [Microlunatus sagamiharensis]|uniref:Rhodanese-related sulfurtransferase n=1 Tax=Microlunatus sagamiharensis TaxID=546874 RepID=A0A1H2NI08_9ACTN|nr:rhodanese-like domain-containing protein [Microlunatus sagamiharensis]SDV04831.1 Rhodanese-related sulfurtransferase [Microlunatus sagamiharensis]